jgi:hypothetical protein
MFEHSILLEKVQRPRITPVVTWVESPRAFVLSRKPIRVEIWNEEW